MVACRTIGEGFHPQNQVKEQHLVRAKQKTEANAYEPIHHGVASDFRNLSFIFCVLRGI